MITPAQQHWQNVMAQRAGRANEGVDHAARTAHEEVLYRLRLAQARLKGVQARSAKAAIKKAFQLQMEGKGFTMVEVLSTCPTNWGQTPQEALQWVQTNMIPTYPLGVYKDITAAPAAAEGGAQ